MTYITENIIAMGFPAGDMSSGFFGFVEVKKKKHNLHMKCSQTHLSFTNYICWKYDAGFVSESHGRSDQIF